MSIPNLITLGRILLVPVVVWAIIYGELWLAFVLFLAAGVSDAVDAYAFPLSSARTARIALAMSSADAYRSAASFAIAF